MNVLDAIILSIIEGITEFLPISSTGHLILAANILGIPQTEFVKTFEIVIQSGAIFAVILLYGKTLLENTELLKKVMVAFLPTGIIGLTLYRFVKGYLLGNTTITLLALFIGGLVLIGIEKYFKVKSPQNDVRKLSYRQAVYIGLFQAISIIPGTSRSAATIIGSMLMGLNRQAAVEFSFLLAIPTMLAATGLDLVESYKSIHSSELPLLFIGFLTSFLVAWIVVKWFLGYVRTNTLTGFGIYRIILALLFFLIVR